MPTNSIKKETVKQIQDEHRVLRELLGQVHQALAEQSKNSEEVSSLFNSLRSQIEEHFHEEESGGFFEQIAEQAPRLEHRAEEVRNEHAHLRDSISRLCFEASTGDGSDTWWQQLNEQFHEFSKELMHHEGHEHEMLQEAYEQDIGPSD